MKKFYYKSSAKTCLKWARCLWFPTSDCLKTWLIPSGTTRSRQYYESTMVWSSCPRITTFGSLSCPFGQKSVTKRRKHCQRWYKGRLRRTMVDSWYCLDRVFPEGMIGNHGRHGREPSTTHSQSPAIFWHSCTHITKCTRYDDTVGLVLIQIIVVIKDRVVQNLEIISENFQFSARRIRILMGFIIGTMFSRGINRKSHGQNSVLLKKNWARGSGALSRAGSPRTTRVICASERRF